MNQLRHRTGLATIIILSCIILLLLCLCVIMWFKTGEEASVGIFSLAVTLLGTIFIAIELRNGQHVTCSDMLIDLNNYFHESDRLMKVYGRLEEAELDKDRCRKLWADVTPVEIAQYCTFFENLYLLYKNEIADIEDLDDLFGYRFFTFIHNPYIQEHYILPTSSSYVQIFKLYQAWTQYRRKTGGTDWKSRIPLAQYMFSQEYLEGRTYLHDCLQPAEHEIKEMTIRDASFTLRDLSFCDLDSMIKLQDECVRILPAADLYYPLSRDEFLESLHLDKAAGVFHQGSLVAMAVIVNNRANHRNIAAESGGDPLCSYTFDCVMVSPQWRGYSLQKALLTYCMDLAKKNGITSVFATVAPDNEHSLRNFTSFGFEIISTSKKYSGLTRHTIRYTVPE